MTTFRWSDEERLLLGMTDPQGGKWRYVYDRQGHITETHDPLGRVAQTQWHPVWHQPETEVDAAGNTGRCVYDERGNLLAVTDPLQQNTRYQYDRHGQVVQITDARGGINTSSGMKTGSSCGTRTVPARRRPGSTTNARGLSE